MSRFKIVEFFENSQLLNVKNLSPVQRMTLKAIMGEPLDDKTPVKQSHPYQESPYLYADEAAQEFFTFNNEIEMFKHFSGKSDYIPQFYSDPDLCFGRRSGKSTTIGAGLAIYFATQFDYTPYLGTSPHATIPIISPTKEQANEVYQSIKNFFLRSPVLFKKFLNGEITNIQDEHSEEDLKDSRSLSGGTIRLNNKVIIKVMAADTSKLRGMAVPFAILDEVNFFGADGSDLKNTDKAIYEALAPALSQFTTVDGMAMVLKISSPNGQSGLMYDDYEKRAEEGILHLQVPSWYANPSLSVNYLKKQERKGNAYFQREYGAQYTASETSYLDPNLIDAMILGIDKIDYQPEYRYVAVMDYATKKDYWAFGIGHKETVIDPDTKAKIDQVVVDLLIHWRGTDGAELDPSMVVPEICNHLKAYRVTNCIADQYAFAALKPYFQKDGCILKEFAVSSPSKIKYFFTLQVAVNSRRMKMVHNSIAIKHLKDLREKRGGAHLKIEAAHGSHDDYANVVALIQYQFDKTSPIYIGMSKIEKDDTPQTKDARGHYISTPTAMELAEYAGISQFHDNKAEIAEKEEAEEIPDDDGFWFVF